MTAETAAKAAAGVAAGAPPGLSLVRASREIWRLAWKDLWHDRRTMAVFVLTVAAILAPLLLLLGLKNGAMMQLRETLISDPRNLEVIIYGSARLPQAWFAELATREEVAFVVPKTRTINASVDLLDDQRRLLSAIELLPTGAGDPLLPVGTRLPEDPQQVLITATLAEQLGLGDRGLSDAGPSHARQSDKRLGDIRSSEAGLGHAGLGNAQPTDSGLGARLDDAAGDPVITAVIKRSLNGERQHTRLPLTVVGIVPERAFARAAIFAQPALLVATEDYRDGVIELAGDQPISTESLRQREEFANARLYARNLEAVAPLAEQLRRTGIEIRTQAERIATVQALDRTFSFLFRVTATIGGIGCALALGGALWLNADRKRRALAMLRLFGFGRFAVALLPVLQALIVALGGLILALLFFAAGASVFNLVLGENLPVGGYVSRLSAMDMVMATGWMLLLALMAAGAAAWHSARVAPAEGLRDVL
ncbi:FtsX-like permease family protein [Halochromatium sp.]